MAGDIYFNSVMALLHGDTSPVTDVKGHSLTVGSGVTVSTETKKYGAGSINFDGTGDAKISCNHSDFALGSGDITVECWISPNANPGAGNGQIIYTNATQNGSVSNFKLWLYGGATLPNLYFEFNGYYRIGTGSLNIGQFYFVQLVRESNTWKLRLDGVQTGTYDGGSDLSDARLAVGYDPVWNNSYLNAKIDDLRVTKGVARANVVPTEAFPDNFGEVISADATVSASSVVVGYASSVLPSCGTSLGTCVLYGESVSFSATLAKVIATSNAAGKSGATIPTTGISRAKAVLKGFPNKIETTIGVVVSKTKALGVANAVTLATGGIASGSALSGTGGRLTATTGISLAVAEALAQGASVVGAAGNSYSFSVVQGVASQETGAVPLPYCDSLFVKHRSNELWTFV